MCFGAYKVNEKMPKKSILESLSIAKSYFFSNFTPLKICTNVLRTHLNGILSNFCMDRLESGYPMDDNNKQLYKIRNGRKSDN